MILDGEYNDIDIPDDYDFRSQEDVDRENSFEEFLNEEFERDDEIEELLNIFDMDDTPENRDVAWNELFGDTDYDVET